MTLVCGDVEEGHGAVADAFRRNFADGREIGAACAVYRDGVEVSVLTHAGGSPAGGTCTAAPRSIAARP
ncbi:hypothetical protein [Streptomyces sp. NBRC 110035]|nr:hypothetical protein [Streptomyces sp. NBRC 110035]